MPGMPGGSVKFWMGVAEVAGRLLEEAQFGVIEETSPNHSLVEAKRAMKRSNPMKLVERWALFTHSTRPLLTRSGGAKPFLCSGGRAGGAAVSEIT